MRGGGDWVVVLLVVTMILVVAAAAFGCWAALASAMIPVTEGTR